MGKPFLGISVNGPTNTKSNPVYIVPIVYTPEDFVICVAGGNGRLPLLSSWCMTQAATEVIEKWLLFLMD